MIDVVDKIMAQRRKIFFKTTVRNNDMKMFNNSEDSSMKMDYDSDYSDSSNGEDMNGPLLSLVRTETKRKKDSVDENAMGVFEKLMKRLMQSENDFLVNGPVGSDISSLMTWKAKAVSVGRNDNVSPYQLFINQHLRFLQEICQICRLLPFPVIMDVLRVLMSEQRLLKCISMFFQVLSII
jgi:hypothetical protein